MCQRALLGSTSSSFTRVAKRDDKKGKSQTYANKRLLKEEGAVDTCLWWWHGETSRVQVVRVVTTDERYEMRWVQTGVVGLGGWRRWRSRWVSRCLVEVDRVRLPVTCAHDRDPFVTW